MVAISNDPSGIEVPPYWNIMAMAQDTTHNSVLSVMSEITTSQGLTNWDIFSYTTGLSFNPSIRKEGNGYAENSAVLYNVKLWRHLKVRGPFVQTLCIVKDSYMDAI